MFVILSAAKDLCNDSALNGCIHISQDRYFKKLVHVNCYNACAMATEVRHYKILTEKLPDEIKRVMKRLIWPQILVLAVVLIVSIMLAVVTAGRSTATLICLIVDLPILAYVVFISPKRTLRRLQKYYETFVLEIGPYYLLRRQAEVPDLRLSFQEIKQIDQLPGKYLRVIGKQRPSVIGIPESIESFSEIQPFIVGLAPVRTLRRDRSLRITLLYIFGFGGFLAVLWSESPWVVFPLAVLVSGLLIWLFTFLQRSPNVARRSKRVSWIYLLFVIAIALKALAVFGKMSTR